MQKVVESHLQIFVIDCFCGETIRVHSHCETAIKKGISLSLNKLNCSIHSTWWRIVFSQSFHPLLSVPLEFINSDQMRIYWSETFCHQTAWKLHWLAIRYRFRIQNRPESVNDALGTDYETHKSLQKTVEAIDRSALRNIWTFCFWSQRKCQVSLLQWKVFSHRRRFFCAACRRFTTCVCLPCALRNGCEEFT